VEEGGGRDRVEIVEEGGLSGECGGGEIEWRVWRKKE
jgi:hypothetical protein